MNTRILKSDACHEVREAVGLAVQHWPNAHLGSYTPREDIRSAFLRIRHDLKRGDHLQLAAARVASDAYSHADM